MEVTDAVVRKCKDVTIFIDKKMQECRIEHNKYIMVLDENISFNGDEPVKLRISLILSKYNIWLKGLRLNVIVPESKIWS